MNDTIKRRFGALLALGLVTITACYSDGPDGGDAERVAAQSQASTAGSPCDDPTTATIVGTAGDDTLLGTAGDDIIFGLGGDDVIQGKGGNDILCGGSGQDSLQGGDGDDVLYGGAGFNWLYGNAGNDSLYGGDDSNELQGGDGDDTVVGGAAHDTLYGGDDNDVLRGLGGDDDLIGGTGDDCMDGGAGDDSLNGNSGDDCLNGGDGVDQLVCGADADTYENGEWDFSGCESAGSCNCEAAVDCPCLTPNSVFEDIVNGNAVLNPPVNGFCAQSSSTVIMVVNGVGVAAGGEANSNNSGIWSCESSGGQPGDVGFLSNLTQAQSQVCADQLRDALLVGGVHPPSQCTPW